MKKIESLRHSAVASKSIYLIVEIQELFPILLKLNVTTLCHIRDSNLQNLVLTYLIVKLCFALHRLKLIALFTYSTCE